MEKLNMNVQKIWEHIGDEESKKIFGFRCMYYLTGDSLFLRKTALTVPEVRDVYNRIKKCEKRKLIFGAGIWGEGILRTFNDIEFECFIDNYKEKKGLNEFGGKKVISFQEYLSEYSEDLVLISSRVYNGQIYRQLIENGIDEKNIINIGKINDELNKRQYFDLPQLKQHISSEESFVDGGSLDGRSSVFFKEWCEGSYKNIFAFEPDVQNKELCKNMFQTNGITNYEIITKGLWDKKDVLRFEESGNGVSKIVADGGNTSVEVDCLDNMINDKVTFIKMDIEGAEYNALLGGGQNYKRAAS